MRARVSAIAPANSACSCARNRRAAIRLGALGVVHVHAHPFASNVVGVPAVARENGGRNSRVRGGEADERSHPPC